MIKKVAVVGGGASGFFAALRCAEVAKSQSLPIEIKIFEASSDFLRKVKISGGGRCNVTHHLFEVKEFCQNYPRGQRELLSPFQNFQARDTVEWFRQRGVLLKYENDGRMFPVTDDSETIVDCFLKECRKHKVQLIPNHNVQSVEKLKSGKFSLRIGRTEGFVADVVLLSTGSKATGYELGKRLGHKITDLAPSLFTFKIKDMILEGLAGTSFLNSKLTLKIPGCKNFLQQGPLLITHWGLSGPALLKLSAWAAREMKVNLYKATLVVNWVGTETREELEVLIQKIKSEKNKSFVMNAYPENVTKRFWLQLLAKSEVEKEKRWADLSKKEFNKIINNLYCCELQVSGKSRFKEEFVECGGINLKEINFKTMESKICPGLFFAGEIMDIDGVTGGFNFQNAWTSGWIAGSHMALVQNKGVISKV